jgi:hypothetical protein
MAAKFGGSRQGGAEEVRAERRDEANCRPETGREIRFRADVRRALRLYAKKC